MAPDPGGATDLQPGAESKAQRGRRPGGSPTIPASRDYLQKVSG